MMDANACNGTERPDDGNRFAMLVRLAPAQRPDSVADGHERTMHRAMVIKPRIDRR